MENIKLTQYSHGAGCGCKISPKVLDEILKSQTPEFEDNKLLVGNKSKDDAAVYDLGNGTAIISTTDFFMPIVDDPFDFGQIASVNAISDVYAMGGKPMMAIAILGWPLNKIPTEVAQRVLEGSRNICKQAGIILAGGHSIDSPEPIFGLAVTGIVEIENLKRNDTATIGCSLFLTKPLGVGLLTTAQKKGTVKPEHLDAAKKSMLTLNKFGYELGKYPFVKALTDVTGFGLLGHLCEICEGSGVSALIDPSKIPAFEGIEEYIEKKCYPGGTTRNWESYGNKVIGLNESERILLSDPQTSGGLLVVVENGFEEKFGKLAMECGILVQSFGKTVAKEDFVVAVPGF